ncbi:MAG: DNA translocase SpoIIIE [candidate division WS6 bacterium OLB20]|uniref:DNA translocase SpoIIIE n=1 Tax=candidate division WS6 bacterium OLB20 TaxID=1617426 RepID=A0A136LZ90_9BACT|nr:MAG: DNA translocase SpoIIIE [candidate division WS6 bacterium OLB20]
MAKKKRGRPRKKKGIQYDSQETRAVIGLLFLFAGLLGVLSYFMDGGIFTFFRSLTGDATIFLAILCFNSSLHMFDSKFPLAGGRSLAGQALFVVFYAAFVQSIFGGSDPLGRNDPTRYGGIVGSFVYTFLLENIFLNFTPVFIIVMIVLSIPLALSMTILEFLDRVGRGIEFLWAKFSGARAQAAQDEETGEKDENIADVPILSPSTFGDFRRQQQDTAKSDDDKDDVQETPSPAVAKIKQPKVEITEESKEGAYINEELQYPDWKLPPISLLNDFVKKKPAKEDIRKNADIIEQTLNSFGVKAKVVDVLVGPSVTQYALDIALGTKVSKIANLSNDLALALATSASAVRIEAPIPGTSYVGIEVPNAEREAVFIKEIMSDSRMKDNSMHLPLAVGKNIAGDRMLFDLQKMPHLLIAGATGSGKSILTNGFIVSLLMTKTPDEVKFIMVDPKQVELSDYNGIPHLLTPVITEMDKVLNALKWAIVEMERRYTIFKEAKVRNIEGYNNMMGFSAFPYIVVVIDEMADMMMSTNKVETESAIVRLAQKARATGIHLVLATQRPSVDVITGLIKANIPGRIGMSVTTQIDSRVILDHIGAESLLGRGDMLFKDPSQSKAKRVQGMWVAPEEIQNIVKYIKDQVPEVRYTKEVIEKQTDPNAPAPAEGAEFSEDDEFANALRVIVSAQKGSASLLQRKLSIGYNRAARLLDELEEHGVVGPPNGSKPRDVLITDAESFLEAANSRS